MVDMVECSNAARHKYMSRLASISRSSSAMPLLPGGAFPTASRLLASIAQPLADLCRCPPIARCPSVTLDRTSYALSKPRTLLSRADVAGACFSPGFISGSYPSMRADQRRMRLPHGGVALRPSIPYAMAALRRCPVVARHPSVTPDRASYAISWSHTPTRAASAIACLAPGPIFGSFLSARADKRRARHLSSLELDK